METATRTLAPKFDLNELHTLDDPYDRYRELRDAGPLCRLGPGTWGTTRHAETAALARDSRLGNDVPAAYHSIAVGADSPAASFFGRIMVYNDAPMHAALRRPLARALDRTHLREVQATVAGQVDAIIDNAFAAGRLDAVADLGNRVPVQVMCDLLGIEMAAIVERWDDIARFTKALTLEVSEDERPRVAEAITALRSFFADELDRAKGRPRADLLSRLHQLDIANEVTHDHLVDNLILMFFAGFDTSRNLLGHSLRLFAEHPDQFARLRANPALAPSAVEEALRYEAPTQVAHRIVQETITVGDKTLRPGRMVLLMLGCANRDDRVFVDADRFDIERENNPHVSFGGGPHVCLGAAVARHEARVVFERLAARCADVRPAGTPTRDPGGVFRSFLHVPVELRPA